MESANLLKLALFLSILGLFILCIIANFVPPPKVNLVDVESRLGQKIIVEGEVVKATIMPTVTFLDITDGKNKVTAILFGLPNERLSKGDRVRIFGSVARYKGETEMIITELTLI